MIILNKFKQKDTPEIKVYSRAPLGINHLMHFLKNLRLSILRGDAQAFADLVSNSDHSSYLFNFGFMLVFNVQQLIATQYHEPLNRAQKAHQRRQLSLLSNLMQQKEVMIAMEQSESTKAGHIQYLAQWDSSMIFAPMKKK
jgi:hypothetical protein